MTADTGTVRAFSDSSSTIEARAVIPAISFVSLSVIRIVVGMTRSVEPPPFSSPVGEIEATTPWTVAPFKMSADISASCPSATFPIEYSLTLISSSSWSRFSITNSGASFSILSAKRPTFVFTRTTVPSIGAFSTVSSRDSVAFS